MIYLIASVILMSIGEALNDKGSLMLGHIVQPLSAVPLLAVTGEFWTLLGCFVLLRFALFDYHYNLVRGFDWYYHSDLHIYGKVMNRIGPFTEIFLKLTAFLTVWFI